MAYWCDDRKQWRLDGFVDVKYDEGKHCWFVLKMMMGSLQGTR